MSSLPRHLRSFALVHRDSIAPDPASYTDAEIYRFLSMAVAQRIVRGVNDHPANVAALARTCGCFSLVSDRPEGP